MSNRMSNRISLSPQENLYLQIMEDLHNGWAPHDGQLTACSPMVNGETNVLFIQCGRKWGKSELAVYLLWRHALLNPGSACYYICPELAHGREIVWANQRMQKFCDRKYIKGSLNQEMRLTFNNGSFIKVFGSENWAAANGLTPDFVVYDEFKIFHPNFHNEMNPNRLAKKAPLVIIGTPPKQGDRNREQYLTYAEECNARKDSLWVRRSSYDNPHIDKDWLDNEKDKLITRGEPEVWYREYEAKYVIGGNSAIFPMWDQEKFVKDHNHLMYELKRDIRKLEWFITADPGSTTCFAVLIGAVNPYTKHMYLLDEIYETDQRHTTIRHMYPRMDFKMMELYPNSNVQDDWCKSYDEAAAWFSGEVMNQYGVYFMPTQKHLNKKEHGLSLIKDQMIHNLVTVSSRCEKLIWEIENYAKDDKGNIPKKHDHLIDCWRYKNAAAHYNMVEVLEIIKQRNDDKRRMYSMESDMAKYEAEEDWTASLMKDWYK